MNVRNLHDMVNAADKVLDIYAGAEQGGYANGAHTEALPPIPAAYYVTGHYEFLLYVGQTSNLRERFGSHHRLPGFRQVLQDQVDANIGIHYAPLNPLRLQEAEAAMIHAGKPPLNNTPLDTLPVFVGAWLSPSLFEKLRSFTQGYSFGTYGEADLSACIEMILSHYLR